jgi:hypothetical protein
LRDIDSKTKVHEEKKTKLRGKNQELQQELEALKVSVPYIHQAC